MMSLQRNYYEVLGLPPGATTDQIKKKYRELARKFHPDVVQDKALGQRVFTQINQAYSVLGDPERRAQYNGTLTQGDAASAASKNGAAAPAASVSKAAAAAPQPAPAQSLSAAKSLAVAEMLGRAENAIMAGKPVEARAFCMRILEADPGHVKAMEILGDALVQMGRRDEAAVQYRRALQAVPSTLIQAKLNRVMQTATPTRTVPPTPPPPARNGNGAQRTNPPTTGNRTNLPNGGSADSSKETEKPGGLIGRLLGRK